ncbi:MAG: hypothetical protein KC619_02135 [Myxococcales bacterium]|nr:hypothetical protein [Myxococcales bacterium]
MTVVSWNGVELPEEMRSLPTDRYLVVADDEVPALSSDQEAGLEEALSSIRAGRGVPLSDARDRVSAALRR